MGLIRIVLKTNEFIKNAGFIIWNDDIVFSDL